MQSEWPIPLRVAKREVRRRILFCMNDAGMLLKTKDRCGRSGGEAGMCLKTKEIGSQSGNVIEKKG